MDTNKINLDISYTTLFKLLIFGFAIWLSAKVVGLFFILILGYIIAVAVSPFVLKTKSHYKNIPTGVIAIAVYSVVLSFTALILILISGPLVSQTVEFLNSLPSYVQNFLQNSEFLKSLPIDLTSFIDSSQIINGIQGAFGFVSRIFGGLAGLGIAIVISLYMIIDKDSIINALIKYLPKNKKPIIKTTIYRIDKNLSSWLLSQLILSIIIGVLSYIGLSLLGIDYALPLAVLAAFLELIPNLGPIITFFIMVFISVATGQTITITILVGMWFILQQLLENYVIVPRLMKRVVGLSPVITISAIIAGSMAFGLLGAIVAVPVVKTVSIIIDEYLKTKQEVVEEEQIV